MAEPENKRGKFDTNECSICPEPKPTVNKTFFPCGHTFCFSCVKSCHQKQDPKARTLNCPICRAPTNKVEHSGKRDYTFNKERGDGKKRRAPRRRKRAGKKQPPTAN